MATKANKTIDNELIANERDATLIRRKIAIDFRKQEEATIRIPPLYKPYFGRVLPIMIQGIEVAIPVDGNAYKVPKVFADRALVLMTNQDELIQKGERASDVKNNYEQSPGDLVLF